MTARVFCISSLQWQNVSADRGATYGDGLAKGITAMWEWWPYRADWKITPEAMLDGAITYFKSLPPELRALHVHLAIEDDARAAFTLFCEGLKAAGVKPALIWSDEIGHVNGPEWVDQKFRDTYAGTVLSVWGEIDTFPIVTRYEDLPMSRWPVTDRNGNSFGPPHSVIGWASSNCNVGFSGWKHKRADLAEFAWACVRDKVDLARAFPRCVPMIGPPSNWDSERDDAPPVFRAAHLMALRHMIWSGKKDIVLWHPFIKKLNPPHPRVLEDLEAIAKVVRETQVRAGKPEPEIPATATSFRSGGMLASLGALRKAVA